MLNRALAPVAFTEAFGRQMRFVIGPRQAGKTSLARAHLQRVGCAHLYFNWDLEPVRARYRRDASFFLPEDRRGSAKPWVCFDEIHKAHKWKNILKGAFDAYENRLRFIVTGSASIDLRRRTGDSLAGRFFSFRLNPLTAAEVTGRTLLPPPESANLWIEHELSRPATRRDALSGLLEFGPFPEPLLKHEQTFRERWMIDHFDRMIRSDMRDLTPLTDLHAVEELIRLLPERVGSPLSVNALTEDLRVAYATTRRYVHLVEDFHVIFSVPPWTRSLARAIHVAKKAYLYDYARIDDPGARYENFVALELKARCDLWTDSGNGRWTLHYVRKRDGKESDFLIVRNGQPWCLLECKLKDGTIDPHHRLYAKALGGTPLIQLCRQDGIRIADTDGSWRLSAGSLL